MADKHIIAGSGGFQYIGRQMKVGPIINYILKMTNKERPKFCFIGTASGDADSYIKGFYNACSGMDIEASHLELFSMPNHENIEDFILSQDAIFVGGGSVSNLIAVWETHDLFPILRKAWEKGIILSGVSAGSLCWNAGGTTDSFGLNISPFINKNGFLPYSSGVHYDSEEGRRPLFQQLIAEDKIPEGYATDDGVCIHFVNDELYKVISDSEDKAAYKVYKDPDGIVKEDIIHPELLT